ncbi:MAG: HlyD family secretion protein [Sulfurimonas sp.]|uniref:HlyD family secretion protein n=1 Tax=Sulfurimonas sp. TaxID=2022749 RepID=UPI003D0FD9B7
MKYFSKPALAEVFVFGNGRLEATEYDLATKLPGRVVEVLAQEGETVKVGQILARLDTAELDARLKQAQAQVEQARQNKHYTQAVVKQHESEVSLAKKNFERSKNLYVNNNISLVQLQQNETALATMKAALLASKAQVIGADSAINALLAQTQTIEANLNDCILYSPIEGRVLYKLVESGEVIGAGGKVLTILDLNDVYMTIFLPTFQVGRVKIGSEARIKLDAFPDTIIPASVSFVSPDAQFTPKEIETQAEREKLMFKVKVKIDANLLKSGTYYINSGVPGVAYVRLDETTPWPASLSAEPDNLLSTTSK